MGMAPLAMFLRDEGCEVSGFDDNPNPEVKRMLLKKGVKFCESKEPDFDTDEFIITSALKYVEQNLKGAPCKKFLRRGVALSEIAKERRLVGVCGSHGKTTTTSLISHAISALSLDAGYITGAIPNGIPPQKFCEKNKILAAELDESDGTIENFSPEITVEALRIIYTASGADGMIGGQMLDIEAESRQITEDELLTLHRNAR